MGDKSPKAKNKSKKQSDAAKAKKNDKAVDSGEKTVEAVTRKG